jgi:hypothetical protein
MEVPKEDEEKLRKLIIKWRKDPVLFAKQVFKAELTPKQIEFIHAFQHNKRTTMRGGTGLGKTFSMAILLWWSLITHNKVQVTIFGPNETNLKSVFWKEVRSMYGRMPDWLQAAYDCTASKAERKDASADCWAQYHLVSKENVEGARGVHMDNNFVFVDEATGVDREIFTGALLNILADKNSKLCLVSNPNRINSFFYDTFYNPTMNFQWTKVHATMRDGRNFLNNPEAHDEQAIGYGAVTSPNYRAMVLGEFPLSDSDTLIPREYIDNAIGRDDVIPAPDSPVVWGLDPAGKGRDKAVLCKRHDNTATFKWWDKSDSVQLADAIMDEWAKTPKALRPVKIVVDSGGIGDGVFEILRRSSLPVIGVQAQNRPTRKPELYLNMRALMWVELRNWICDEERSVNLPNINELIEDMTAPNYWEIPKYKIESKEDIKKRTGRSTDFADALCLTFAPSKIALTQASANGGKVEYDEGFYSHYE